jgi:putative transposase
VAEARARPAEVALLYADEKTVHRQPAAADAWGERGRGGAHQPRATLSHRSNTKLRLAGALDAVGGRVVSLARSKAGVREMCELLRQARAAYPSHGRVVVAWDNWPIHSHPKVLAAAAEHRVELLFLPTYAPWTNPIEKLWGWLQRDVLTMHRLADQWDSLKQRVLEFLARFDGPSPDLLRMVGLN